MSGRGATSATRPSSYQGVDREEEEAFSLFVRSRGAALLRQARLLVPDDGEAEDALQTALLRLARHWSRGVDAPEAYVRAVLVNLARDRGRRRHLVPHPVVVDESATADRAPDHLEVMASRAELDDLLSGLPPRQRAAVVLRVIVGLSEAETARAMRTSVGTAKSNLARGLARLRATTAARHQSWERTQG